MSPLCTHPHPSPFKNLFKGLGWVVPYSVHFVAKQIQDFYLKICQYGCNNTIFSAHYKFSKAKPPHWLHSQTRQKVWLVGRARESMRHCRTEAKCNQCDMLPHLLRPLRYINPLWYLTPLVGTQERRKKMRYSIYLNVFENPAKSHVSGIKNIFVF